MNTAQPKTFLTTGEFAKLCHTTKHTLFHYYEIGLFLPAYINDKGYRYYHVLQYDTFRSISELRALGMPLKDIKHYLDTRSPQHIITLYQQQEQLIRQELHKLETLYTHIHQEKERINHVITCTDTYFTQNQAQLYLACSECIEQKDDYIMTTSVGSLMTELAPEDSSHHSGMLCPRTDALYTDAYPFYFYIGTTSKHPSTSKIKPAGLYLCTYHHGTYETMHHTFKKLLTYAENHALSVDDWIYAETIIGDWIVRSPSDYVVKISVQLRSTSTL